MGSGGNEVIKWRAKMPKIEPFEEHIDLYEGWFEKNKYAYESELEAIRSLLPKKGKGIEIGVGSGKFAVPLGIKVGIEPSEKMGRVSIKRGIEVIKGVAEALPIDDAEFDFALMVTTICFVDDIKKAFSEVYRILKPNGSLIIGFVDRESPLGREYEAHKNENLFYKYATFYTTEEIVNLLKEIDFKTFSFVQTIFHKLDEIKACEPIEEGYGKGSFVVIKAVK